MKLNLGAGGIPIEGYTPIDIKNGKFVYPLPDYETGSVDEIRASHILEHFPEHDVVPILREWVRVLKQGGLIRIAVPNAALIGLQLVVPAFGAREAYLLSTLMGEQKDEYDWHRSAWTEPKLWILMTRAGLVGIKKWISDAPDCASYPISLNLEGFKE